jgi:hypothetical protein
MSEELNMEAERAAFEAKFPMPANTIRRGEGYAPINHDDWDAQKFSLRWQGWLAARRTAPVSAPLDTQALPPLPNLEHIDVTYAIAGKIAEFYPQETPRDMETNHRLARAIQRLPLLRKMVQWAIAPYAEHIKKLERELEQAKSAFEGSEAARKDAERVRGVVGSIGDYTGFCSLLDRYGQALVECETAGYYLQTIARKDEALAALIAYIDGRTAGTAPAQVESAPVVEAPRSREWQPVTGPGQVRKGDMLRFKIGDKRYDERAKQILHPGTDKEEVIYDKGRNFYFITAMVMSGFSNHKCVEVLAAAPTPTNTGREEANEPR